jgi:hypothetical protein
MLLPPQAVSSARHAEVASTRRSRVRRTVMNMVTPTASDTPQPNASARQQLTEKASARTDKFARGTRLATIAFIKPTRSSPEVVNAAVERRRLIFVQERVATEERCVAIVTECLSARAGGPEGRRSGIFPGRVVGSNALSGESEAPLITSMVITAISKITLGTHRSCGITPQNAKLRSAASRNTDTSPRNRQITLSSATKLTPNSAKAQQATFARQKKPRD